MPERIQRKRTKGWRMPAGAVYVGRPTRWGNPYTPDTYHFAVGDWRDGVTRSATLEECVGLYEVEVTCTGVGCHPEEHPWTAELLGDVHLLRGYDLACWCPLGQPCHGDVLLRLANA